MTALLANTHPEWRNLLRIFILADPVLEEYLRKISHGEIQVYPSIEKIFRAFEIAPDKIRLVILGQDPYPTAGHAIGRAFAVEKSSTIPYSLNMIFKELGRDKEKQDYRDVSLDYLVKQDVLLLNTALTVSPGIPGSHTEVWKNFTRKVLRFLSKKHKTFLCLGKESIKMFSGFPKDLIYSSLKSIKEEDRDLQYLPCIAYAPHPAGDRYIGTKSNRASFIGSNVFSIVEEILIKKKQLQIKF